MVGKSEDVNYRRHAFEVRQTTRFATWLAGLRDERAGARILKRIDRTQAGNLGDVGPVGEGVSEMRIFDGRGTRCISFSRDGSSFSSFAAVINLRRALTSRKPRSWRRRLSDGQDRNDCIRLGRLS